ncbi:MAG: excinuclease ABC subunit C [Actinobacteria bacterium]|nr:MAG: excinuclease ABC subunit C [Actinomycetota bacterium]
MATPRLESKLKALPAKPGVYLFRDDRGEVLYVGKAKSLRPRVRSYFQQSLDSRAAIQQLPDRVADIEVIVTGTEVEALHLEQNLVKRHRPPFNVRLRDDKSFPYIAVTVEDEYPRVMFTRERHRPGVWYFGPYANAKKVRETLDVLNRVFPYRPCEGPKPGRHSGIPCLDYHIDRCLAPCVGYVLKEDYRAIIDGVIEFLSGNTRPIQRELEQKMKQAADEERFEDAARHRNRLFAVQGLAERQAVERQSVGTVDVIGFAHEGDRAVVQIFPLRGGKMVDRHSIHLENVGGQDLTTILEAFGLRRRACRRRSSCRRTPATSRRSPRCSRSGAARASRFAVPSAVRSGACRSSRRRTHGSHSAPRRRSRSRSGCGGSRRSRSSARR